LVVRRQENKHLLGHLVGVVDWMVMRVGMIVREG
jgi:hypothetical protein